MSDITNLGGARARGGGTPAAPVILHVATDAAKRALTGLVGDETVIIDNEGNRVERFVPAVPTVVVSGGTQDGVYFQIGDIINGHRIYNLVGTPNYQTDSQTIESQLEEGVNRWVILDASCDSAYYNTVDTSTPPSSGWLSASDDTPASITVTRHDEANQDNWVPLRNTINLRVTNSGLPLVVNGVSVPADGSPYDCGWPDPSCVSFATTNNDDMYLVNLTDDLGNVFGLPSIGLSFSGTFAIPYVLTPRHTYILTVSD